MIVGRDQVDVDACYPEERLPLETRRVEARRIIATEREDIEGGAGWSGVGRSVRQRLRVVDAEGEELEEGAKGARDREPAAVWVSSGHGESLWRTLWRVSSLVSWFG